MSIVSLEKSLNYLTGIIATTPDCFLWILTTFSFEMKGNYLYLPFFLVDILLRGALSYFAEA